MTNLTLLDSLFQYNMTGHPNSKLSNETKPQILDSPLQEVTAGVCMLCTYMFRGVL